MEDRVTAHRVLRDIGEQDTEVVEAFKPFATALDRARGQEDMETYKRLTAMAGVMYAFSMSQVKTSVWTRLVLSWKIFRMTGKM